jgi:hypothetical protein
MSDAAVIDMKPKPRTHLERIGSREWELPELRLDISNEVSLWADNPRLQFALPPGIASEAQLEAALAESDGYDNLRKSIDDLGQMEPIYVWRADESSKYVVLEGATRLSILRTLDRKYESGPKQGKFRLVKAKVLPPEFGEADRIILLARIHVRGSGVREWKRYTQAKFIYEAVTGKNGQAAIMNVTEMAQHLGKSVSWVQRLRDAYRFAHAYVEHLDGAEDAAQLAATRFSVLEEISKATTIGAQLRDYDNQKFDALRGEVFDMVRNEAFKEYREARFLKDFYDDPEKWEQLKSGERHIASRLALEVKTNTSSVKSKIAALDGQVQRAIERKEIEFGDDDLEILERAMRNIHEQVHPGVRPFRIQFRSMTKALTEASMADVKALTTDEVAEFKEAHGYFNDLLERHWKP